MSGKEYSLYFHIPFCTRKCDYCHFYVIPNQASLKTIFLEALKKEWLLRSPHLPDASPISIYFGGGTPALLGAEYIAEILSWIPNLTPDVEITLEANPENITQKLMESYCLVGINRVSIGIQSLDPDLLTVLSRTHSHDQAANSVEETHAAGIENISIDLMYDLPGQTLATWQKTLDRAITLPIQHLSLYNLTIEPHTVFYKKKPKLPRDELSLQLLENALSSFEKGGFDRYEISAFARNGRYSKHNVGYWTGRPFLGFGPSAFSYWEGARFRNIANLQRYARDLSNGQDPTDFQEKLPKSAQNRELFAIGMRLKEGMKENLIPEGIEQILDKLIQDQWIEKVNGFIRLTEMGRRFYDSVASELIE